MWIIWRLRGWPSRRIRGSIDWVPGQMVRWIFAIPLVFLSTGDSRAHSRVRAPGLLTAAGGDGGGRRLRSSPSAIAIGAGRRGGRVGIVAGGSAGTDPRDLSLV